MDTATQARRSAIEAAVAEMGSALGRNVRELREAHGWSGRELTRRVADYGVSVGHGRIAKIEMGESASEVTLAAIAAALGTTLPELRGETTSLSPVARALGAAYDKDGIDGVSRMIVRMMAKA